MGSTGGVHLLRDVETQKCQKTVVFWLKITQKTMKIHWGEEL